MIFLLGGPKFEVTPLADADQSASKLLAGRFLADRTATQYD